MENRSLKANFQLVFVLCLMLASYFSYTKYVASKSHGEIFGIQNTSTTQAQVTDMPPYDPSAIFNSQIPDNYPTDPQNGAAITKWTTKLTENFGRGVFFQVTNDVPGLYKSTNSSPLYTLNIASGAVRGTFHAPTNMAVGSGSDYPLIILNTDTLQELRLWQATIDNTNMTITASNGGIFNYNNNGDIQNPIGSNSTIVSGLTSDKSLSIPFQGSGAGNGLSYYAGMITREDWDSGVIKHAIRVAFNSCNFNSGGFRIPAVKTDQPKGCTTNAGTDGIEMGMILQLSKSLDCNLRTSPTNLATDEKLIRMVCKAMQDYGAMISDGTGAGAVFYMENDSTANWSSLGLSVQNGHLGNLFREPSGTKGIPWDQFRILSKPYSYTSWTLSPTVTPIPTPTSTPTVTPTPTPTVTATPGTDTTAPNVTITNPLNGSSVPRRSNVTFSVTATDNVAISRVEFYINNSRVNTDISSPYSYTWRVKSSRGIYPLTVKAYDTSNNVTIKTISVTVI